MTIFKATLSQIRNNEFTLDDIRDVFQELNIQTVEEFKRKKKEGIFKIPSFDNLNALCLERTGKRFEKFFFGNTELNKKKQARLMDDALIVKIKTWCADNQITTINEYRQTTRPPEFPTYKSTIDNYGEEYFYEVLGLKKHKENFSDKIIDDEFIQILKAWCIQNNIDSRNEYENKKPENFPSLERIRQLTLGSDYFTELLELNFKSNRSKKEK